MMAYQKISPIANPAALVDALKAFVRDNVPTLTYVGNCGTGNTRPSFKNDKGYFFNLDFTTEYIATTVSKTKPDADIQAGAITAPYSAISGFIKSTIAVSNNLTYPSIACSFFTDGKLVVIVLETLSGIYRHHAFGNLIPYGNFEGGEFIGGTATLLNRAETIGKDLIYYQYPNENGECFHPFLTNYARGYISDYSNVNNKPDPNYMLSISYRNHMLRYKDEWLLTASSALGASGETFYCIRIFDYDGVFGVAPNTYNGRVQLAPIVWNKYYERASSPNTNKVTTPLFHTDFVAMASIDSFQVEEVLNNEWILFPLITKIETIRTGVCTKNLAIAYKK